ncbi:MAG: helix-turn-helix domain-containing protein [Candidatus Acidiferrales bacterium]
MKPEPIYKTIGTIIRRRRRRLDWPQALLASRLGISRATLANIETGRQRVLVHHLYTLAEVLKMKPSDFLPPASLAESPDSWAQLPIPSDLKPQQKEQIARLIGPLHQTMSKSEEGNNGKSAKTIRRRPR